MNQHHFSGAVFLSFITASLIMSGGFVHPALGGMEKPGLRDVIQGKWAPSFEKSLNKSLPVYDPSRNLWGRAEYELFGQARKGAVVGADGWLFTDEEFSCPPHYGQSFADNLAYITKTKQTLAEHNTRLAVVIVPEKARVLPQHLDGAVLPGCREKLYGDVTTFLKNSAVPATDLLHQMQASVAPGELYLKTDTHWSPAGARVAASTVAGVVRSNMKDIHLSRSRFVTQAGDAVEYSGDLSRYVPGVPAAYLPPDRLQSYSTDMSVVVASASNSLFDDSFAPEVTLVGTSYSANPKWNFAGFLKEALQADVLNAADEGMGPFTVMDKYLSNEAWKSNPPKLLVWEIPERYLLMPHGVSDNN